MGTNPTDLAPVASEGRIEEGEEQHQGHHCQAVIGKGFEGVPL